VKSLLKSTGQGLAKALIFLFMVRSLKGTAMK